MLEEGIFLSSLIIGFAAPSILILIGLCKGCGDSKPREPVVTKSDAENVETLLVESNSSGKVSSSSEEKSKSESVSLNSDKISSSDKESLSRTETANSLERLRRNCNNLLDIFPLEDSDRAGMGSLIDDIISSPKFIEKIESKSKNPNDIAAIMMEAASGVFSKDEQTYIQRKVDCLTTLVKAKESSTEKNPEILLATINHLTEKKTQ